MVTDSAIVALGGDVFPVLDQTINAMQEHVGYRLLAEQPPSISYRNRMGSIHPSLGLMLVSPLGSERRI
jgi:hypothetical protein